MIALGTSQLSRDWNFDFGTVEISILYEIILVPPWLWEFFAVKNFSTYRTQKSICKQYERVAARTRTIFRPPNKVNLIFI